MKTVITEDRNGFLRGHLIRNNDPIERAHEGIPVGPPDLSDIDWHEVEKQMHNALVKSKVYTYQDVQRGQGKVVGLAARIVKNHVVTLYRNQEVLNE